MNQARAQAQQAAASVQLAKVNLEHTIIRAPIDGVVVARNVDVGQTVAASFQAPTLFLIAKDLRQMQVLADIDEADIGQLGPDSRVTFTVDAYPAERSKAGSRRFGWRRRLYRSGDLHCCGPGGEPGTEAEAGNDGERYRNRGGEKKRDDGAERGATLPLRRAPKPDGMEDRGRRN